MMIADEWMVAADGARGAELEHEGRRGESSCETYFVQLRPKINFE